MKHTFSFVLAFQISVLHTWSIFNSAMNRRSLLPQSDTTPNETLLTGMSVRRPSTTNLAICLPWCFTSKIRWTLIFLNPLVHLSVGRSQWTSDNDPVASFKHFNFLLIGVLVLIVKLYTMSIILGYLKPIVELWGRSKLSILACLVA